MEIEKLRKKILEYDKAYAKGQPLVPDYVYDFYKKQLNILEETQKFKISEIIGPTPKTKTVTHLNKILSLDHDFGQNSIEKFIKKIEKKTNPFPLIGELKIDGVSIIARYKEGILQTIATRGNGTIGEDITHLKNYLALPEKIFITEEIDLRCEAYINKNLISNPRNAVAGMLSKKTPDAMLKNVKLAPHNLYNYNWETYEQLREIFKKLHLMPIEQHCICNSIEEMQNFFKKIELKKENFEHEIDGVVFKVNEKTKQELLGETATAPRFAFAIKFENSFAITKINEIQFQVGKIGKITPVAVMEEAIIKNRKITKATLNNFNELRKIGYAKGDIVKIELAGEVIPKVKEIIEKSENITQIPFKCPSCNMLLENEICQNGWNCQEQKIERLSYFASKTGLNIKGLSHAQIAFFVNEGILNYPFEFFEIEKNIKKIQNKPTWLAQKSLKNLLEAIEKSKYTTIQQFYTSISLPQIGKNKAEELEKLFPKFENFINCLEIQLEPLGPTIAKLVYEYKEKEKNWMIKTFNYLKLEEKYIEKLPLFE